MQEDKVELKLGDLQSVIKVIDVAAARGAFRGEEMTAVGQVRDRISAFLKATLPQENTEAESSNGNGGDEVVEEKGENASPVAETKKPRARRTADRPVA